MDNMPVRRFTRTGAGRAIGLLLGAVFAASSPQAAAQSVVCSDGSGGTFTAGSDPKLTLAGIECQPAPSPQSRPVSYGSAIDVVASVPLGGRSPVESAANDPDDARGRGPGRAGRPAFESLIETAAQRWGHDPALIHAVIQVESSYAANAVSPKGAIGLMQIMPDTARRYGIGNAESALRDPALNIDLGARHLHNLKRSFGGDVRLALAGYNAGEQAVLNSGRRVPPFTETQAYVREVLDRYVELSRCTRDRGCR